MNYMFERFMLQSHDFGCIFFQEGKKYFVVSLRRFEGIQRLAYNEKDLLGQIVPACAAIAGEYGMMPLFVSMQPNLDLAVSKEASAMLKDGYGVTSQIIIPENVRELMSVVGGGSILSGAEFVCSMRLHTLIYASSVSVPVIGLSLDPKIDAFTAALRHAALFRIPDVKADELTSAFRTTVERHEAVRAEIEAETLGFRRMAEKDVENVIGLLS